MSSSLQLPMSCQDLQSGTIEINVKEEMSSQEDEFGEELIPDTFTNQILSIVDDIEIKHEDVICFNNNTSTSDAEDDSEPKSVSSFHLVDCSSIQTEEEDNDLSQLYLDLLNCGKDCETCLQYMRILSKHIRSTHIPPQPVQDPLHIESFPPHPEQSTSVQICEVYENIVKMECTEEESKSKFDPYFELESESDPDYSPSTHLTPNVHKIIHTGRKLFKSNECEPSCSSPAAAISHRTGHTVETPHRQCLTDHKRKHTGVKPYKCDWCEKSFTRFDKFTFHKRVHTGERPYECDKCEKSYARSDRLTEHMRTHTGEYKCDVCEKCFSGQVILTAHRRTHTGEKPFKCDECGKSFSMMGTLTIHRRIHTGERPFKCPACDKRFISSCDLTKHKKRLHPGLMRHSRLHIGGNGNTVQA